MIDLSRYAIVEAPSGLGLRPSGVERAPSALLEMGLAERLQALHAGRVNPPQDEAGVAADSGLSNAQEIALYAVLLADALGPVLDAGRIPVVLGGDCSILLGSLLALRRRGRFGLLFVDGHADFYTPEDGIGGEAASMDLALATGHGPRLVTDLERRCPLIRTDDSVAFGFRDPWADPDYGQRALPDDLLALDLHRVRMLGVDHAVNVALSHLLRPDGPQRFWLHLDADVLDDAIMPAVDYRMEGGMTRAELTALLRAAVSTRCMVGIEITIFNPALDPTGSATRMLVDLLAEGLAPPSGRTYE